MDYLLLFGSLLSFLLLYKYVALFILIFLGATGLPTPGNTLIIAVGAFVSQGYFNLPITLIVAVAADISGDLFDYVLMRKWGVAILKKNYHKRFAFVVKMENDIRSLKSYITRHQNSTIFITRFIGLASTIVNCLSGLFAVPFWTFILYDTLGNCCSVLLMFFLGFFISESWQTVAGIVGIVGTVIYAILLLALIIFLFKRFGRNKKRG